MLKQESKKEEKIAHKKGSSERRAIVIRDMSKPRYVIFFRWLDYRVSSGCNVVPYVAANMHSLNVRLALHLSSYRMTFVYCSVTCESLKWDEELGSAT